MLWNNASLTLGAFSLFRKLRLVTASLLAVSVIFFCPSSLCIAASSLSQLHKLLSQEQEKAAERRQSLSRLTSREKKVNANLAYSEKRILELEKGIALRQRKLLELGNADDQARQEYEALLAEQAKTEKAQTEALRLLWEITGKRISVGNRDLPNWDDVDREYAWSQELYGVLESHRQSLDVQETKLVQILGRRDKLSRDMQKQLEQVNAEKSALLKSRLAYDRELSDLRKQRGSAEAELNAALKLIASLNFEISQRFSDDITKMRGKLPLPVNGKVRLRYAPQSNPPSRGLGFSTSNRAEVRAIAAGKVVHNDVLRGFGTVLILQHGEEYYSLYAFLGSSPLRVGQDVESRQAIGAAGLYPAIDGPGLYFELRFKQKAINPEPWFAS